MTWYPVGLSADIGDGVPTGTYLTGRALVLWRDGSGTVHGWHDRCPHRGMRLSLGFLRNDQLACPYHGWRYDTSGRCVHVPAHPALTPSASVRVGRYDAIERAGIVWCSESTAEALDMADSLARPIRSVTVHAPLGHTQDWLAEFAPTEVRGFGCRVDTGSGTLLLALQPFDAARTVVHAVHLGDAPVELLRGWARRLGTLRDAVLDGAQPTAMAT